MSKVRNDIADALANSLNDLEDKPVMLSHFVVIAEAVNSDGEYYLFTVTDDTPRPWLHAGLIQYALEQDLISPLDIDDED